MAEIINLKQVRKRKARDEKAKHAAENRARFGRTKAQKAHDTAEVEAEKKRLDQLKRETPPDDKPRSR